MLGRILALAWLGTFFSATAATATEKTVSAPQPEYRRITYKNVELTAAGELVGQIVSAEGVGQANTPLQMTCGKRNLSTTTDEAGRFRLVPGVGGTCLIRVGENVFACRVWKQGTAPPQSVKAIALVNEEELVVRGNRFRRQRVTPEREYGLAILAAGGVAAYMALSRDNASE